MTTIEVSEEAEWKPFEDMARVLEQGLGGSWKDKARWPRPALLGSAGGCRHAYAAP